MAHWDSFNPTEDVQQRTDMRLYSWAIRGRWPIPPDKRELIVEACLEALQSENERNRQMAIRNLIAMDRLNLAQEIEDNKPKGIAAHIQLNATAELTEADLARIEDKRKAGLLEAKQQAGNGEGPKDDNNNNQQTQPNQE